MNEIYTHDMREILERIVRGGTNEQKDCQSKISISNFFVHKTFICMSMDCRQRNAIPYETMPTFLESSGESHMPNMPGQEGKISSTTEDV